MENKTLLIAVALLLAGLAVIYFARDVNSEDTTNSGTFENADVER